MERVELLVAKKMRLGDYWVLGLTAIGIFAFSFIGIPLIPGLWIPKFIVLIGLVYFFIFLYRHSRIEYDYCYFQGELDVDRVFNKSSRKSYLSFNISEAEMVAPFDSERLSAFGQLKILDVSSGDKEDCRYAAVLYHRGIKTMLIIQANNKLLDAIYRTIPSKFFRD